MKPLAKAALLVALYASVYAAFCLWLATDGHAPSAASPLLDRETHYRMQAMLLVPVSMIAWLAVGATVYAVARALGGTGPRDATIALVGRAWAGPTLALFVVPDIATYAARGFDAIAVTTRWTAPLTLIVLAVWLFRGLRREHRLGGARSALAVFAGVVLLGLLHGPWLR